MEHDRVENLSRRRLIKSMSIGIASIPFVATPSRAISRQITLRDQGGVISQAYKEVLYQPFTQATGIKVVSAPSEPSPTAQIRAMVNAKRLLWDMAVLTPRDILSLTVAPLYLEEHALERDPAISSTPPQFISPYGVGTNVYTTVIAYRTSAFKAHQAPETWKDLWDINHFPGRRSLRKHPFDTVEVALMGEGVSLDKVYPCDLDRAFRSLDRIKPYVNVWWTNGTQTEQLLKSQEIDLASVWQIRAQAAIRDGAPFRMIWNQHLYSHNSWAILKGSSNIDACRQFIKFASDPKRQALLAPYAISPTHPDAFKYIDSQYARLLVTYPDNLKRGLHIDAAYWAKHQQTALERFNDWMLN